MIVSRIKRASAPGFSLVEVAIAVGIAAFGLVALLGLLPQGLEMVRKTTELSVHRQIMESITRDLENTAWVQLDNMASTTRYFDDEGNSVDSGAPTMSYVAGITVSAPGGINSINLPQAAGTQTAQPYLRKVTVKIATTTNSSFDFSDNNSANYATFNHIIARIR